MSNNDVNVTMNATTGSAQQAWMAMIGYIDQSQQKLMRMGRSGHEAGEKTGQGISSATTHLKKMGDAALTLAGVGGPLAAMLTVTQLISGEIQQWKQLSQESSTFMLQRASALSQLTIPLGVSRKDRAGKPFGIDELQKYVQAKSIETGIPQMQVLRAMGPGLSSATEAPGEEVADVAFKLAETFPHLQQPERQEELTKSVESVFELMKASAAGGTKLDVNQAVSGFAEMFRISRANTLEEFAGPFISTIASMVMQHKGESIEGIAAYEAAIQQAAVDPHGRRSATNLEIAKQDVMEQIFTHAPELRDLGINEARRRIRDATPEDKKLWQVRQNILGSYAPDVSDEDIKKIGFQAGSLKGEARTRGIIRASFIKDSAIDKQIEIYEKELTGLFAPERVRGTLEQFKRVADSPALLALKQENARRIAEEQGNLAMSNEARRMNILEMAGKTMKQAEAGPAGLLKPVDIATEVLRVAGSEDPAELARMAENWFGEAARKKTEEAKRPQTQIAGQKLKSQIDALQAGRDQMRQQVAIIEQERSDFQKQVTQAQVVPVKPAPTTVAELESRITKLPEEAKELVFKRPPRMPAAPDAALAAKTKQVETAVAEAERQASIKEERLNAALRREKRPDEDERFVREQEIKRLRESAVQMRAAIGIEQPPPPRHELELRPEILRRTPSKFVPERREEERYLKDFLEQLFVQEGVPRSKAIQEIETHGPVPQRGESAADELKRFVESRKRGLDISRRFAAPEKLTPQERQQAEVEIEAERRALKRAESVLEGRKFVPPSPKREPPKPAVNMARRISEEEAEAIFTNQPWPPVEAKEFAKHVLPSQPQTAEEEIARIEAAANPAGEHATPQDALRAMQDVLEDIKSGKIGEHAATSKQDSDRLLSAIEKLTATMERLAAGSGVPRAQASQVSGILPPVLPLLPPLPGVGE